MSRLTEDDYRALMERITNACRVFNACSMSITDEDLAAAAHTVELADAVGYVVDPTAYRTALYDGRLERQRALIKAFRDFRAAMRAIDAAAPR
jgi:hypothetical protein